MNAAMEDRANSLLLTEELIDGWASTQSDTVALHLKQKLLPVEGEGGVIFPPTYADIGYNIDTLSDGTRVATIDSVGSQANRLEPLFKSTGKDENGRERNSLAELVPQIEIELHSKGEGSEKHIESRSLLDLAHRSADAVVQASPSLAKLVSPAFLALHRHGDAGPLCALAPTSLVFGVWDSRGETGEKRPRLIRSIIRAWNVEPLFAAAQFNSTWKSLDEEQQEALQTEAKAKKVRLSEKGFADAPATFRKVSQSAAKHMTEFRNGSPNAERRVLGGVIARGPIERNVTINLVALRAIRGELPRSDERQEVSAETLRRYLLALALLAGTRDHDLFLREGCHLRYGDADSWYAVPRRGHNRLVDLASENARSMILKYATRQAVPLSTHWPKGNDISHRFDLKAAKKLIARKEADDQSDAV